MVDNTALLCTPGKRLPRRCLRDGHGALLSAHGALHFFLICSTRQSLLNLLSPTRKPDYLYEEGGKQRCPYQTPLLPTAYLARGLL